MQGNSVFNWLSGITMIVVIGVVVSNDRNVATIFGGLGNLYSAAAGAARSGSPTAQQ